MRKTIFSGLTVLELDESVVEDGGAFIGRDRDIIDHFLELGARTHRHNAAPPITNPQGAPSAAVIASAGTLPADQTYSIGFTLEDSSNGETILSPTVTVSTPPPLDQPEQDVTATVDHDAGDLPVDTYYYAIAWVDGEGGETPIGPAVVADVDPGFANSEVLLAGLTTGMATASAIGWRLFRAVGGGDFGYLASGTTDTYMDDGSVAVNCDIPPVPDDVNSTLSVNSLRVDLPPPGAAGVAEATFINVYLSEDGEFSGGTFLEQFPVGSAGQSRLYTALDLGDAAPPDVSTSVGGANQIDPDTELLDWHWKRPVAASGLLGSGAVGDVKLAIDTGVLWGMLQSPSGTVTQWTPLGSGDAGMSVTDEDGPLFPAETELEFRASGAMEVGVADSGGRAIVTLAPFGRQWASATVAGVGSGASASYNFAASAAGGRLLKISTNKRARVRVYGDDAARTADLARAIGTLPEGDHGVLLDYANTVTPSGGKRRLSPAVDAHNLDEPAANVLYLNITNYDATGDVIVAFLYVPTEVV